MAKQRQQQNPGKMRATKVEVNTFMKGMRKDISKTVQTKDSYTDAKNIRLTTDLGGSLGAMVNIKGNELSFTLPTTSAVWELDSRLINIPPIGTVFYLQIKTTGHPSGIASLPFTITKTGTEAREEMIIGFLNLAGTLAPYGIQARRISKFKIVIWGTTDPIIDTGGIEDFGGLYFTVSRRLPIFNAFEILGTSYIREETEDYTILFTCASPSSSEPNGQLWKVTYNEQTLVATIELIYNHKLNFSIENPIEAIGRYETESIQRVYWTDRHRNEPRTFNIADTDAMAVSLETVDLAPGNNFNKATFKSIQGGGRLKSGLYQYAYRLKSLGAVTRFSTLSNQIHVVQQEEETALYWKQNTAVETLGKEVFEYIGSEGEDTGKSITIKITNVGDTYDQIEVVSIYKADETAVPLLEIFEEEALTGEDVEFTHTGNETLIPLSLEQIEAFGIPYDTVQTIESKDNRLFVANTRGAGFQDLKFNARTYRYKADSTTYVSDINVDPFNPNIPQTDLDAINPFNYYDTDPRFEEYKYKADGTTLGGEGPNVSYRFIKEQLEGDKYNKANSWAATQPEVAPLVDKVRTSDTAFDLGIPGQTYQTGATWKDYKNPSIDGTFKGYTRGEIYRFGLVLFDLKGNPGYVEWIADIKMPEMYDEEPDYTYNGGIAPYTLGHTWSNTNPDNHKLYPLGIQFTVDISSIKDKISGYSIVRVHRTDTDKTRLATGLVTQTVNVGTPSFVLPLGGIVPLANKPEWEVLTMPLHTKMYNGPASDSGNGTPNYKVITFDSPDFQFGMNGPKQHQEGDKLRIVGLLQGGFENDIKGSPTFATMTKFYDQNRPQTFPDINGETAQLIYDIDFTIQMKDRKEVGDNPRLPDISGTIPNTDPVLTYYNIDSKFVDTPKTIAHSSGYGTRTQIIKVTENIEFNKFWDSTISIGDATWISTQRRKWKLLASYERPIKDQYGGNTEAVRSNNEYISCGNFVPVNTDIYTGSIPLTFDLYGGDTYVSFYGETKIRPFFKDGWPADPTIEDPATAYASEEITFPKIFDDALVETFGTVMVFPTECQFNVDLRKGCHALNRYDADWWPIYQYPEYINGRFTEAYEADPVYARNNDILNYFPRPIFTDRSKNYDVRIYTSEVKVNGETADSWRDFTTYTYIDLEGVHGPINKLSMLADTVYAIQDKAFAKISINPTAVVQSETDISLQLGRGGVLDDYKYVSTKYGSKHQWSVLNTDSGIYFFDVNHRKLLGFDGAKLQSLSDTAGMSAYFANQWKYDLLTYDNPIEKRGIATTYDSRFGEVIFTFRDREAQEGEIPYIEHDVTIAYSEPVKAFTGFYSFHPPIYINDGKRVLTPKDTDRNKVYVHNQGDYGNFYGTVYPSTVNIVCNESPVNTKAFDNMSWHTEVIDETGTNPINLLKETINTIRFYNDYQNSDYITLTTTNLKREEREWQMQVARDSVIQTVLDPDIFSPANLLPAQKFKKRIRSKYMLTDLTFDNTLNRRLILHYIKTFFRISIR